MMIKNERVLHIDFLKIVAIFMVLFTHTGVNGFVLFTVSQGSVFYSFYLFNAIFVKMAVPLFFMASGALLLGKEESYKTVLKNRFLKYFVILIIVSVIQYVYQSLRVYHQPMSVSEFFKILYTDQHAGAYWYLYAYLAYILLLPLLRKLVRSMKKRDYLWIVLLFFLMSAMSIFDFLVWKGNSGHNPSFSLVITNITVFYPIMGYFLEKKLESKDFTGKRVCLMTLAGLAAIVICCLLTHYQCVLINEWDEASCQTFFETLIFIPTITVYYAVKMWFMNHKVGTGASKLLTIVSGTVFGIFLFENIYREETFRIFRLLKPYLRTLPACWVWVLVAFLVGFVITLGLKKIPGIKKFL